MWLPQRFEQLPSEEPPEARGYQLEDYPSHPYIRKSDFKGPAVPTSTECNNGAAYNTAEYTVVHRKTRTERLEEYEHHRFGTRIFAGVYDNFISGWRAGLVRSFLLSLIALLANIAIYTWLFRTYDAGAGTATLKSGPCSMIRNANTGIHAALNIISTLILGASTYAMQGITAPTRDEVDVAHAKGQWVEIGAPSLRSLLHVRRRNAWIWMILAVTSMPFHLFFNAVFFTSTQANHYAVAVVEASIFNNTTFQATDDNSSPDLFEQYMGLEDQCDGNDCSFDMHENGTVVKLLEDVTQAVNMADFARLEPLVCMQTYASGFVSKYGDVVVVSTGSGVASPVLYSRFPQRTLSLDKEDTNQDPFHWICHDIISRSATSDDDRCSVDMALERYDSGRNWTVYGHPVGYCLARTMPDVCELQFNQWLMLGVVIFGGIKTIIIAYLLIWHPPGRFLRTLGDAIASFLESEDPTTKDMCLVSSKQIRKHGFTAGFQPQIYSGLRPRWFSSANTTEFFSTISLTALYILTLSIALYFAIHASHGFAFDSSLGAPDVQSLAAFKPDDTGSSGIVPTLLVANVPQLGFSLLYVVYNNILSKLLVAHEFDRLTMTKKGLRVSERPRGMQRASHFFSLPARFALPLMACSAALHWLCSQSFFMVRIDGVNAQGIIDQKDRLVRLGYSARGIVALISVSMGMLIATACIGAFVRMGTPLHETSMSAVISAACHPERFEVEPWLQEVQWGDVSEEGGVREGDDGEGVRHASFTARFAKPMIAGQAYR